MNIPPAYRTYATFFLLFYSTIAEENSKKHFNESLIETYKQEICQLKDTCEIIDQIPSTLQDLRTRNCMCDYKCSFYKDCCTDANRSVIDTGLNFLCTKTRFDGGVYMLNSCPTEWNVTSVTEKCSGQSSATSSKDILLKLPVTGDNGITYGNVFCAICNQESDYNFWNLGFTCEVIEPNINGLNSSSHITSHYIVDGTIGIKDILDKLSFNETHPTFYSSYANESSHRCYLEAKVPSSLSSLRYCVPDVIESCQNGTTCGGNTSYVYFADKVYKNPECAKCNGRVEDLKGCTDGEKSTKDELFEISITDPSIKEVFRAHCHDLPENSHASDALCENKEEEPDECYISAKKPKITCYISKVYSFSKNEYYKVDNKTVFVHEHDAEFPESEWEVLDENDTDVIYVCGRQIPRTRYQRIMNTINDVTTEVLIKISIVCIVLHLLAFLQLSELQNLSGKNLASFCVALLAAFLSFDIGPWLPSCEVVAIIEHYCFLSCFTWMLIMSYDVWLSLYRATSQFRTSGGKHQMKFLIYSILAWTLPLLVVCPAVYAEFSPSNVVSCDLKPGYGKLDQCFIAQKTPLIYFFFIPATVIFFVNILFFAHTAYMIYLSQRKTVNPNTRHDFRLYTRLGLLMGLTWTLGFFVTVTNSELIGLLFTLFNMSQGIFIFFGFTFKRKTAKGLLQRHRDNKFLSSTFSNFVSNADVATTMSETTTSPRQTQMDAL